MSAAMGGLWPAVHDDRSPLRRTGRRLAWAAGTSIAAHALLLAMSAPAPSSAPHAVTALLVRTISATREAAAPPQPAPEPAPATQGLATGVEPRALPGAKPQAGAAAEGPVRAVRTSADRVQAPPSGYDATAARPLERSAEPPLAASNGPVYHAVGELDPPPRPLHDIEPEYPVAAGFQPGKVVLRLFISETGEMDRVDVIQGTPPGLFEAAARTAFANARFSPGRIAGLPVKCQLTIEVEFTPINRGHEVSGRTY